MQQFRFINLNTMDVITSRIINEYNESLLTQNQPVEIPIEEIIEFHYGFNIEYEHLNYISPDVIAAIFPESMRIVMNESKSQLFNQNEGFHRFTFAHELGHWVLHVEDKQNLQTTIELGNQTTNVFFCRDQNKINQQIERQADLFAGSILMPKKLMESALRSLSTKNILRSDLHQLASCFGVSKSALQVRINQLKLLYIDNDWNVFDSEESAKGQMSFQF